MHLMYNVCEGFVFAIFGALYVGDIFSTLTEVEFRIVDERVWRNFKMVFYLR